VTENNSRTGTRRIAEYAAVVDEANRRTLNPIVVEVINACRPSPDLT
jgi:hypothetical protein